MYVTIPFPGPCAAHPCGVWMGCYPCPKDRAWASRSTKKLSPDSAYAMLSRSEFRVYAVLDRLKAELQTRRRTAYALICQ